MFPLNAVHGNVTIMSNDVINSTTWRIGCYVHGPPPTATISSPSVARPHRRSMIRQTFHRLIFHLFPSQPPLRVQPSNSEHVHPLFPFLFFFFFAFRFLLFRRFSRSTLIGWGWKKTAHSVSQLICYRNILYYVRLIVTTRAISDHAYTPIT